MQVYRHLPTPGLSFAEPTLTRIRSAVRKGNQPLVSQMTTRVDVLKLALASLADFVIHTGSAAGTLAAAAIQLPLRHVWGGVSFTVALKDSGLHLVHASKSIGAALTVPLPALVSPNFSIRSYRWLALAQESSHFSKVVQRIDRILQRSFVRWSLAFVTVGIAVITLNKYAQRKIDTDLWGEIDRMVPPPLGFGANPFDWLTHQVTLMILPHAKFVIAPFALLLFGGIGAIGYTACRRKPDATPVLMTSAQVIARRNEVANTTSMHIAVAIRDFNRGSPEWIHPISNVRFDRFSLLSLIDRIPDFMTSLDELGMRAFNAFRTDTHIAATRICTERLELNLSGKTAPSLEIYQFLNSLSVLQQRRIEIAPKDWFEFFANFRPWVVSQNLSTSCIDDLIRDEQSNMRWWSTLPLVQYVPLRLCVRTAQVLKKNSG